MANRLKRFRGNKRHLRQVCDNKRFSRKEKKEIAMACAEKNNKGASTQLKQMLDKVGENSWSRSPFGCVG